QYRHNLFDRKALAFHGKPPPGSGSSLPQNSLSDWSRIPNADQYAAIGKTLQPMGLGSPA
ncbi:hypothetical protein, partial [Burkholderia gladioli]|uniref:hypothetical protein n=1 Tax=Burkholderia gladioli TaxID=28095 RepID=UPI001C5D730C